MIQHQKEMAFEPSPEVEQHLLPEHQPPKESKWRKGLPKDVMPRPLNVDDFLNSAAAHIIQVED